MQQSPKRKSAHGALSVKPGASHAFPPSCMSQSISDLCDSSPLSSFCSSFYIMDQPSRSPQPVSRWRPNHATHFCTWWRCVGPTSTVFIWGCRPLFSELPCGHVFLKHGSKSSPRSCFVSTRTSTCSLNVAVFEALSQLHPGLCSVLDVFFELFRLCKHVAFSFMNLFRTLVPRTLLLFDEGSSLMLAPCCMDPLHFFFFRFWALDVT